jgi:hypothetical protein
MRRNLFGNEHLDIAATIYNAAQTHHQRGDMVGSWTCTGVFDDRS